MLLGSIVISEESVIIEMICSQGFSADASTTSLFLGLLESKEQDPALLALCKKFVKYLLSIFQSEL